MTTPRKLAKVSLDRGIKKYASDIYIMPKLYCFLLGSNSIHKTCLLESPQKFCFDVLKIEIDFDIYGIEYVKSVIRRLTL